MADLLVQPVAPLQKVGLHLGQPKLVGGATVILGGRHSLENSFADRPLTQAMMMVDRHDM